MVEQIIEQLDLQPHPEGGYYKEIYRSEGLIKNDSLPDTMEGERNYATGIYFLLPSGKFSAFHRIKQDETWHYYKGSAICLHIISPEGEYTTQIVGNDILKGEQPQYVVKAGDWFAATVVDEDTYSLVGCTVAPGFDFVDFELARKDDLSELYQNLSHIIVQLSL